MQQLASAESSCCVATRPHQKLHATPDLPYRVEGHASMRPQASMRCKPGKSCHIRLAHLQRVLIAQIRGSWLLETALT